MRSEAAIYLKFSELQLAAEALYGKNECVALTACKRADVLQERNILIELGIGSDIVRGIGLLYWLLLLTGVALAVWFGRNWRRKALYSILIVVLFVIPAVPSAYNELQYRLKYEAAKELFDVRCRTAGQNINQTVPSAPGIILLNLRPRHGSGQRADPGWVDAALPDEAGGEEYIRSFLYWEHQQHQGNRGFLNDTPSDESGFKVVPGYSFVDVKEANGSVSRYRLGQPAGAPLLKEDLVGSPARYAVSFVNETDPKDRKYWIAGTTVTVSDTSNGAVLATSTWFALEPGQGSLSHARSCADVPVDGRLAHQKPYSILY